MNYDELKELMKDQKDEMTDGERGAAYFSGKEVDHIPFSLQSNEEAMTDIFGYTTAQSLNDIEVMKEVLRRRRDEFGINGIKIGLRLRTVGEAVGSKLYYPEVGIDRVEKHVLEDLGGLRELLKNDPYKNPLYKGLIERCYKLKDAFPDMAVATVVAGPLTTAAAIRPIELLLRDSVKHKQELKDLLEFCVYQTVAWTDMFGKEFGSMGCGICDPVTCSDIVSSRQYHEFSEPYLKELISGITGNLGKKPGIHICGKTHPLWNDMLDLDVSSFSVDNSEDLEHAKEVLGGRFCLVGNVPPVDVMLLGTIDDVIASCRECIAKGADSPKGYTLGTGCQVPIGTPRENFDAFIYAARKYGRGAKLGEMPKGITDR